MRNRKKYDTKGDTVEPKRNCRGYYVNNERTTNEPRANLEKSREILIPQPDIEHMGARRKEVTNR